MEDLHRDKGFQNYLYKQICTVTSGGNCYKGNRQNGRKSIAQKNQ